MLDDLDNVFFNTYEFADEVVYTPQSGDPATVSYIDASQSPGIMENITPGDEKVILVKDPGSPPAKGDQYTIDGETWYLSKTLEKIADTYRLQLTRSEWRAPGSDWR